MNCAAGAEEVAEEGGTFGGADPAINFKLMIEAAVAAEIENRSESARLGIASAINDAINACVNNRTDAHQAWLEGDVQ